jgi:hypothetical protein
MNNEAGAMTLSTSSAELINVAICGQLPALLSMIEERLWNSLHQTPSSHQIIRHLIIPSQSFISLIAHLALAIGLYNSESTQTSSTEWLLVMSVKNAILAFFDVLRIINRAVLNESLVLIDNDPTQRWFWQANIICNLLHLIFSNSLSFIYNIVSIEQCMIEFMRQMLFDYEIGNTPTRAMRILWRKLIRYMCGEHND